MAVIDPMIEGPSEQEMQEWRKKEQDKVYESVCEKVGDKVVKVSEILDGKTTWNGNRLKQVITTEGEQLMCLAETVEQSKNKTLLQVLDIFATNYDIQSTARFDPDWKISAGTLIGDITSTGDAPSGSSSKVWTRSFGGGMSLDKDAYPKDISYKVEGQYRDYMQTRSVPDYTISPINQIINNRRIGTQGYIID